ncbi:transposase [Variovorax boronicumulans]
MVVDNYATHSHPEVKKWLASDPRFVTHFTPTSASWLNMVERARPPTSASGATVSPAWSSWK